MSKIIREFRRFRFNLEFGPKHLPKWKIVYLMGLVYLVRIKWKGMKLLYKITKFPHPHVWGLDLRCVICNKHRYHGDPNA